MRYAHPAHGRFAKFVQSTICAKQYWDEAIAHRFLSYSVLYTRGKGKGNVKGNVTLGAGICGRAAQICATAKHWQHLAIS